MFASPDWPPYSLLAVNNLWGGILRLRITCHIHSSVSYLPSHLAEFNSLNNTVAPNLSLRLIWKQSKFYIVIIKHTYFSLTTLTYESHNKNTRTITTCRAGSFYIITESFENNPSMLTKSRIWATRESIFPAEKTQNLCEGN